MFALKIFLFEFSGMVAVQLSMFLFVVSVLATAYLIYHRLFALSTTFFIFFRSFFFRFSVVLATACII